MTVPRLAKGTTEGFSSENTDNKRQIYLFSHASLGAYSSIVSQKIPLPTRHGWPQESPQGHFPSGCRLEKLKRMTDVGWSSKMHQPRPPPFSPPTTWLLIHHIPKRVDGALRPNQAIIYLVWPLTPCCSSKIRHSHRRRVCP